MAQVGPEADAPLPKTARRPSSAPTRDDERSLLMDGEFVSRHPLRPVEPRITAAGLRPALRGAPRPILLDVRRRPAFLEARTMIPGAEWRDPTQVYEWGSSLPRGRLI